MSTTNETTTLYSLNDEEFRLDDVHEVMQEMDDEGELVEGRSYFACEFSRVDPCRFLRADSILESASEHISDNCGEDAYDAFVVNKEASEELDCLLKDWARKHITGSYWEAEGMSRELQITAEDIAAFRNEKPTTGEGGGDEA